MRTVDRRECRFRFETRQHDDFAAVADRPVQHRRVGKNVKERQHAKDAVIAGRVRLVETRLRIDTVYLPGIGGNILVAEHRALWRTSSPAGIL